MKVSTAPDGMTLQLGQPFQIQGTKFPGDWLDHASDADLEAQGITVSIAADPIPPASPPPYVPTPKEQALAALDLSDGVAIRCFKAGIPFPADWLSYVQALRDIVKSGAGQLPARPAYPAGT